MSYACAGALPWPSLSHWRGSSIHSHRVNDVCHWSGGAGGLCRPPALVRSRMQVKFPKRQMRRAIPDKESRLLGVVPLLSIRLLLLTFTTLRPPPPVITIKHVRDIRLLQLSR